jgi:hypothetical protein
MPTTKALCCLGEGGGGEADFSTTAAGAPPSVEMTIVLDGYKRMRNGNSKSKRGSWLV